ncbi:hypothetical protein QBC45DRAFT_426893 [Copromyces sp. CBS 386.78]|nr:hypothetical protein QBC45DRAFT_426893 [Copromyces sp. CBS 386.78]
MRALKTGVILYLTGLTNTRPLGCITVALLYSDIAAGHQQYTIAGKSPGQQALKGGVNACSLTSLVSPPITVG